MKQSKTLALLVVLALAITAIFALTACTQDPTVEGITVEIIGGGTEIALTQQTATADAIKGKIKVTANYSDETAKEVEAKDYTVEGLDTTKLNVAQDVTIKYGEFTKKVSVKIAGETVEPEVTVTSIEVTIKSGEEKVVLAAADATVTSLKAAITVKTVKSDNSKQEVTNYTIEGFNDDDEFATNEDITVTIKAEGKSATVILVIEAPIVTVTSIAVAPAAVELDHGADEAALKAAITVTATLSDDNTETVAAADYTIEGFDASLTTQQTVTVKYEDQEATVKVTVKPEVLASVALKAKFDGAVPEGMHVFFAGDLTGEINEETGNLDWKGQEMTANADRTEFSITLTNVEVGTTEFLVTVSDTEEMSWNTKYGASAPATGGANASLTLTSGATEVNLFGEIELAAPAVKEDLEKVTLQLTFKYPLKTTYNVFVIGAGEMLGAWNLDNALQMTANADRTVFTYDLVNVKTGSYEYKVSLGANCNWNTCMGNHAPDIGYDNAQFELKASDEGQTVKLFANVNDGVIKLPETYVTMPTATTLTTVTLQVTFDKPLKADCNVYVIGEAAELGAWAIEDAKQMTANADRTVFTLKLTTVQTGDYNYKITFTTADWNHAMGSGAPEFGGGNARFQLTAEDEGQTVILFDDYYHNGVIALPAAYVGTVTPVVPEEPEAE